MSETLLSLGDSNCRVLFSNTQEVAACVSVKYKTHPEFAVVQHVPKRHNETGSQSTLGGWMGGVGYTDLPLETICFHYDQFYPSHCV